MTDTTTLHEILHPASWKKAAGDANGMLAEGRLVFVGGQIGWNGQQVFEEKDLASQTRQTLQSVVVVLAEAGARPEHVVRMTW